MLRRVLRGFCEGSEGWEPLASDNKQLANFGTSARSHLLICKVPTRATVPPRSLPATTVLMTTTVSAEAVTRL